MTNIVESLSVGRGKEEGERWEIGEGGELNEDTLFVIERIPDESYQSKEKYRMSHENKDRMRK